MAWFSELLTDCVFMLRCSCENTTPIAERLINHVIILGVLHCRSQPAAQNQISFSAYAPPVTSMHTGLSWAARVAAEFPFKKLGS